MLNSDIQPGQGLLIKRDAENILYRVISVDTTRREVFAYPIESRISNAKNEQEDKKKTEFAHIHVNAAKPQKLNLDDLLDKERTQLEVIEFVRSIFANKTFDQLSDEQKKRYKTIQKRIHTTWAEINESKSLTFGDYSRSINESATKHGVHRTTIARDMSRLFICGLEIETATMMTLLSKGAKKKGKTRNVKKKLGRKYKKIKAGHSSDDGANVTSVAIARMATFLKQVKDRVKLSIKALYMDYVDKVVKRPIDTLEDGELVVGRDPKLDMTYGQFNYHLKTLESSLTRAIKQVGEKNFLLSGRILTSHAKDGTPYPGHTYLIDSTVIDAYCVSALDRTLLVGRPTVYVVIDVYSQVVLAVHVTLKAPCFEEAMVALYQSVTDKSEFLQKLGCPQYQNEFVQGVVPLHVYADRAELLSKPGKTHSQEMQLATSIAAAYRPDWKACVERYLGFQNTTAVHWTPGGVRSRQRERGDKDVRLDAVLTPRELQRILMSVAGEWNSTKDMSKQTSCAMIRDEIDASPLSFWKNGLEHLHGSATYLDKLTAVRQYLPRIKAIANRSGIHVLEKLRFTAPWMKEESSFFELIERKNRADVYLDPEEPLSAYLLDDATNELNVCNLVDMRNYKDHDVSIEEIWDYEAFNNFKYGDGSKPRQATKDHHRWDRNKFVEDATEATKKAKEGDTRSRSAKLKNIKANAKDEIAAGLGMTNDMNEELEQQFGNPKAEAWRLLMSGTDGGEEHGNR